MHYGDITMTFLNNWFAADARGTSLTYASAVAVEEKSVIDYNRGNPDGVLSPGEEPRLPAVPLVAIYPEEGTLFSDNPFIVLDTEWVDEDERAAPRCSRTSCSCPENQEKVLEFGFRPNNPDGARRPTRSSPPTASTRPSRRPSSRSRRPTCSSASSTRGRSSARRPACCSCSTSRGSMGELGRRRTPPSSTSPRTAAISALDQFKDADEVGLWVFTTDLGGADPNVRELVPIGPIGDAARRARRPDRAPSSRPNGTPLYDVDRARPTTTMLDGYDPAKINAVVLLTDGVNDDGDPDDDDEQFDDADRARCSPAARGPAPGRCGCSRSPTATTPTCRRCGRSPRRRSAAHYDASNPATIDQVFTAVISNF